MEAIPPPPREEVEEAYARLKSKKKVAAHFKVSGNIATRWFKDLGIENQSGYDYSNLHHAIPADVFAPILARLIDSYKMSPIIAAAPSNKMRYEDYVGPHRKYEELSPLVGVSARRLRELMSGRCLWVRFKVADRLLSFFGMWHLWWTEPLNEYYWPAWEERPEVDLDAIRPVLAMLADAAP